MRRLDMKENKTSGLLISFCGLDGCGKTTMIEKLKKDLALYKDIVITKEPTDFVRETKIFRTYMDSPNHDDYDYRSLSLLAASDRIQHSNKVIEPLLSEDKIVLCDRYFYSCLANLRARGFTNDEWIYEIAHSIIKPDVAFFFDVSVETAISRVRTREAERNRYIDVDLQYKLLKEYYSICMSNNGVLVSTEQSEEESYSVVYNHVIERIKENEYKKNGI